jgi:hypothetical protein
VKVAEIRSRAIVLALLALAGCTDGGSDSGDRLTVPGSPQASPAKAWQVMESALDDHRLAGWTGALATGFTYEPDAASAARYPEAFADWDRTAETAFAQALFAADLRFVADLTVGGAACPPSSGSTTAWPGVEYAVVVSGANGASPVTYRGVADLEFSLEGAFWYLSRWHDRYGTAPPWNEDVVCPTLGELRGAFHAP